MKNRYAMMAAMVVCAATGVAPCALDAKPPIKLFETTEAEEDAEHAGMTISNTSMRASVEVEASEGGRRIEPAVHVTGGAMWLEAKVQGREVLFMVDTGASYTTLTPWFARLIGATPAPDAPVASFQTASGIVQMPFGVMPSLEFGGVTHRHVTFSMCESCGDEDGARRTRPVVGLLGMNVLGRYTMNMDGEVLTLLESTRYANRRADVSPWVTLDKFELRNHSERPIKRAAVVVECKMATKLVRWEVEVERVDAGGTKRAKITSAVSPSTCSQVGLDVLDAAW